MTQSQQMPASNPMVFMQTPAAKKDAKKTSQSFGGFNNLGVWNPGTSARAVVALMALIRVLAEISVTYGDQVQEQIKAVNAIASAQANSQIAQGQDEFNSMLTQGVSGIAGGLISIGGSAFATIKGFNESEIEEADNEEKGLKIYSERVNARVKEFEGKATAGDIPGENYNVDDHIDSIKDKTSEELQQMAKDKEAFEKKQNEALENDAQGQNARERKAFIDEKYSMEGSTKSDGEIIKNLDKPRATKLKEAIDKKLEEVRKRKTQLQSEAANKTQGINNILQGITSLTSGTGNAIAAGFQKDKAEHQADQSREEAGLRLIEGILGQNRSDADKYFQNSLEVNQVINAIRQANQIN
ncbi:MAG: hypothetical protein KDK71_04570 [Chlamydiia bacterium]|nr:hypothetical protein [Chlamydiia bacterium]